MPFSYSSSKFQFIVNVIYLNSINNDNFSTFYHCLFCLVFNTELRKKMSDTVAKINVVISIVFIRNVYTYYV